MRGKQLDLTDDERLERAAQARVVPTNPAERTYYQVGAGGKDPEAADCSTRGIGGRKIADCVGGALYWYGVDRFWPEHKFGGPDGTWWNQNSIYADASARAGATSPRPPQVWRVCTPYVGCLALVRGPVPAVRDRDGKILTPADPRVGHIGMMTGRAADGTWLVTHCSPSNHRRVGQGIAETPIRPETFGKTRAIYFVEMVSR